MIRTEPEDFVVDEVPAYAPCGTGPHAYLRVEKRGLTTFDLVRRLAAATGVPRDAIGTAGLKDRHAVTTQWVSVPLDPMPSDLDLGPEVRILEVSRHTNKLRTGHLRGNRFRLRLREVSAAAAEVIAAGLTRLSRQGVPNAFGPQRFGRDGDLGALATAWVRGERRPPKDRRQRRLWFSSFQATLFNSVLADRRRDGTLDTALAGDLVKKHDTGGMFLVADEDAADAAARARAGVLSATGPMFGAKMRWPEGAPAAHERRVLEAAVPGGDLAPFKRYGEGTRRPLRFPLTEVEILAEPERGALLVAFMLPKGAYATTVLSEVCTWREAPRDRSR